MARVQYTYKDFMSAAEAAGLTDGLSASELRLAQTDPAAGMKLLRYKQDYENAGTDGLRALARAGLERFEKLYGTSSQEGEGQTADRGRQAQDYADSLSGLRDGAVRTLSEPYTGQGAQAAWESYRKQYLRQGERAYQDSLGEISANTGGLASTAAVAAAQQARGYYDAQAADKKAALYQQDYENWQDARAGAVGELTAAGRLADSAQQTADAASHGPAYGDTAYAHDTFGENARGKGVAAMQTYLRYLGYATGLDGTAGVFRKNTKSALEKFQADNGLPVSGVCDYRTWAALITLAG